MPGGGSGCGEHVYVDSGHGGRDVAIFETFFRVRPVPAAECGGEVTVAHH